MTTRWARFVRGWLTASVAVLVAALSHVAAGGNAPGLLSAALALAFAGMASVFLAGKSLSLLRLTLSVGVSQLLLHVLFGLGGTSGMTMTSSHHHGAVTVAADAAARPLMAAEGILPDSAWMWVGHGLAALVTIVALYRGEKTFWALLAEATNHLTRVLIRTLAPVAIQTDAATVRPGFGGVFVPADLGVLLGSVLRRGPPARALNP
ncbi:hypothetical protein E3T26_15525 [Cryobacterium sp. TMT1-21]|uniref:Uncharacterized protein n=1 Tax=Cryobacterium shii TaxID=1259235 RepID=A0AAQ2HE31_9MICO|nr:MULTISPECIES: hypothetical protein [Cryobacterium]TFC41827.1 hypothetical protein E3O49_15735 [Cryobacterium shii]TFC88074.1 hypothetical protein E3T24_03775 [Cryobacterium sp. TmT2-59]TFD08624.1 hypothetical protein E3T26_15525 [Cryobacterium sp. TMT1-21]TFD14811.1 hypothetical protein E3T42_11255 [Cryobacterium sp. TMT4-10]TFD20021.1 hypothetical protein E3T32_09560 [Cryobacterium sp. TMT2-23]